MGSTDVTVDQGGSGGSDALQTDGYPMRRVAAEARRVLLDMASEHFGVPVTALAVSDGVISTKTGDTADRSITYGELIGGKKFNVTLTGRNIDATTGKAPLKPVQAMKNVGKSPRRDDIPREGGRHAALGRGHESARHAARAQRPAAGCRRHAQAIDESSVKDIPGFVKVVSRGNYVAVVCEREENAIRAARQLKVEWTPPATAPFPASENLFTYMRSATPSSTGKPVVVGDPTAAIRRRRHRRSRRKYDVPFQGHTAFGPAHALADPSNDQLTIYSNDMKSYGMRNGVAQFLKIPRERVRVVWMQGPQAYGRTAADDAGFEAAFLAKEIGRPVRMQWTRQEETGVGHQGPGLCHQDARRPRCAGQARRARLRRARRRLQSRRLQRARHGADRAADGQRKAQPSPRPRVVPVGQVRDSESPHDQAASCRCRWRSKRRSAWATCAIPMARR